jgi:hypothetical protein
MVLKVIHYKKDFPLNGYVEVCYDDLEKHVVFKSIEMIQEFAILILLVLGNKCCVMTNQIKSKQKLLTAILKICNFII